MGARNSPIRDDGTQSDADTAALTEAPFDELLSEVLTRVREARDEQVRWRLLLDAIVTLAAELSLNDLLTRITRIAGHLVGARYAALGVLAPEGDRLALFITQGLTDDEIAAIGLPPVGKGLLGHIIVQPQPLRLREIARHEESFGFPPNHPPMHSFLGVPIRTGDKVFGNLYLTEKANDGEFTQQDEDIVVALAAAAGVAIENAHLHEEATRREHWLEASAEISAALLSASQHGDPLQLIADRARELASADLAWVLAGPDADNLRMRVVSGVTVDRAVIDSLSQNRSMASSAVRAGTPLRVESIAEEAGDLVPPDVVDMSEMGPALLVPLPRGQLGDDSTPEGVLGLTWRTHRAQISADIDVALPVAFAEQAILAIQIARARADRERLAVFDDRERIARDLHDIVIQRLFAIGLNLQASLRRTTDPDLVARLDASVQEIDDTIKDIRRTIFELNALEQAVDTQSAISDVVEQAVPSLGYRPHLSFEGPVRSRVTTALAADLTAVLREALSNVTRHAQASRVDIVLRVDDAVWLRVVDDGRGMPVDFVESGLSNIRERALLRGGRCEILPGEPTGTIIEWSVPL